MPRARDIPSPTSGHSDQPLLVIICLALIVAFGLVTFDTTNAETTDPPTMVWNAVAQVDTQGKAYDVVFDGQLVYVSAGRGGLRIIDASDPMLPVELGFNDTPLDGRGVAVVGDIAYLAAGSEGLWVLDISDPAAPVLVGGLDTPGFAEDVTVEGGLAYVADGLQGFVVVDVSDPAAPVEVGSYDAPGYANELVVRDGLAYLAAGQSGLRVYNVTELTNITEEGGYGEACGCTDPTQFVGLSLLGELAFMADGADLLRIFDITDLDNVTKVGNLSLAGPANGIALAPSGRMAFMALNDAVVEVVNVTDPAQPASMAVVDLTDRAYGVAVSADGLTVAVANGHSGLRLLMELEDSDGDGVGDAIDAFPADGALALDRDNDGFPDAYIEGAAVTGDLIPLDDFPDDPAASLDGDGDGYPDEWNMGQTETNSTTGLKLDLYPGDPERWEKKGSDDRSMSAPGLIYGVVLVSLFGAVSARRRRARS